MRPANFLQVKREQRRLGNVNEDAIYLDVLKFCVLGQPTWGQIHN